MRSCPLSRTPQLGKPGACPEGRAQTGGHIAGSCSLVMAGGFASAGASRNGAAAHLAQVLAGRIGDPSRIISNTTNAHISLKNKYTVAHKGLAEHNKITKFHPNSRMLIRAKFSASYPTILDDFCSKFDGIATRSQ